MRHIFMEGEDGSVVELLTQIASTMIGDQGDDEGTLLELAGCLMKTAIKRGQKMGGSGNHSAGSVLSQLFEHLPSEIEHIMHQESHTRRTSKGIRLYHEEEEEDIRSTEVSGNSDTLTDDVGHDSSSRHKLQRHTDGTSVECQTEDPQGLFGSLQEAANRPLLSSEDSIFGDIASDSLKKVALTHWYKDLLALGNKRRYANIAPMNFSKAQSLVYDRIRQDYEKYCRRSHWEDA